MVSGYYLGMKGIKFCGMGVFNVEGLKKVRLDNRFKVWMLV